VFNGAAQRYRLAERARLEQVSRRTIHADGERNRDGVASAGKGRVCSRKARKRNAVQGDGTQTKIFTLLDVLATQVGGIVTRVDGISNRVDAIAHDLSELRKEARDGFERVERRLERIETRVESLEASDRNLDERVTALEKR
jgi:chromosome segregation ATPase